MNVRNCRKCGRLFNYLVGPRLCMACRESLEADFQRVKEYIRENKGATISQVSEECEVEISQIYQWLREERLELTEGSTILLYCETCGAAIMSGRYCDKCRHEIATGFKEVVRSSKKEVPPAPKRINKDGERMRYLTK